MGLALATFLCGATLTYTAPAVVVRVIDGDTIVATLDHGLGLHATHYVRLLGIDAPERGRPGADEATEYVKQWTAEPFRLAFTSRGKYGRVLGIPFRGRDVLNGQLVSRGLASRRCY